MGLEYRNGRPYFYLKTRKNGKVVSEYAGSGQNAYLMQELFLDALYSAQERRNEKQEAKQKEQAEQAEMLNLEKELNELFTLVAQANGYHKDKKRTWRKKRQ